MDEKLSVELSDLLTRFTELQKRYAWCREEVLRQERLTQDYLHKLELKSTTYHQRAKLAAALRRCRLTRRVCKDEANVLEPLVLFLEAEKGKMMVSQLQQVLGSVRKAERNIRDRHYTPKVMTPEEYHDSEHKED